MVFIIQGLHTVMRARLPCAIRGVKNSFTHKFFTEKSVTEGASLWLVDETPEMGNGLVVVRVGTRPDKGAQLSNRK